MQNEKGRKAPLKLGNREIGKTSDWAAPRVWPEGNPGGPLIGIFVGTPSVNPLGFAAFWRALVLPLEKTSQQ